MAPVASIVLLVVSSIVGAASIGAVFARTELVNTNLVQSPPGSNRSPTAPDPARPGRFRRHHHLPARQGRAASPRGATTQRPVPGRTAQRRDPGRSRQIVERFLASSEFRTLWSAANRLAHQQLIAPLKDSTQRVGPVTLRDGIVTVDLSKTFAMAQQQLVRSGLTFVASVHVPASPSAVPADQFAAAGAARSDVGVLNAFTWALPAVMLATLGAAIALGRGSPGRALLRAGVALVAGMAVVVVLLAVARSLYLDAATRPQVPRDDAVSHRAALPGALARSWGSRRERRWRSARGWPGPRKSRHGLGARSRPRSGCGERGRRQPAGARARSRRT